MQQRYMRRIDMLLWFLKQKKLPVIMEQEPKWCTAQSDRDYFKNYKQNGELYYIIDKTKPTSDPFYKIALNKRLTGEEDFWDATDKMHISGIGVEARDNESLMATIRKHFEGVHGDRAAALEKERKQREAERAEEQRERRQREAERQSRLNAEAITKKRK